MLITEKCQIYYEEVLRTANGIGLLNKLQEVLEALHNFGCMNERGVTDLERTRCILFKGPTPLSFMFNIELKNELGIYEFKSNGLVVFKIDNEKGPKWVVQK